jgi:hypothetical protein
VLALEGGDTKSVVGEIDHKLGPARGISCRFNASIYGGSVKRATYWLALKSNNASRHQAQLSNQRKSNTCASIVTNVSCQGHYLSSPPLTHGLLINL